MLLRSLSSPILTSWTETDPKPTPVPDPTQLHKRRTKSFSLNYLRDEQASNKIRNVKPPNPNRRRNSATIERGGGGRGSNGGGKRRGNDGGDPSGFDGTEMSYRKMIDADPNNALLLGNYAKFLKEYRGDLAKAEEYCGRSILANPNDGNVLSMYGDLIWEKEKDSDRAKSYFDQAVKTDPEDCYVLASYARFLWDAEDEEDEEKEKGIRKEKEKEKEKESVFETWLSSNKTPTKLVQGASRRAPLTAA